MMKKKLLILILCTISMSLSAQVSDLRLGIGGIYTYYSGNISDDQFGTKILGEINVAKELGISVGYSFNSPNKITQRANGNTYMGVLNFESINLNFLFYLNKQKVDSDFSIYVPIGMSHIWGKQEYTVIRSDGSIFKTETSVEDNAFNLGFGIHKRISYLIFFSELAIGIPINRDNSRDVTILGPVSNFNELPFYTSLVVGVKVPIVKSFRKSY